MNYKTAYQFLLDQGNALATQHNASAFLMRLQRGEPPIAGQMTSILLALKTVFEATHEEEKLDRLLLNAIFTLAFESRNLYDAGLQQKIIWPPLLKEDIRRIEIAARNILAGTWQV